MRFMYGLILIMVLLPYSVFSKELTWETHLKKSKQWVSSGQYEQAINYLSEQTKRKDLHDADRVVISLFAVQYIFNYGDKKQALFIIKPIYEDMVKKYGVKGSLTSWAREILIRAYIRREEYNEALKLTLLAVKLATTKNELAEAYLMLGDVYNGRKEYNISIKNYEKGEQLFKQLKDKDRKDSDLDVLYNNMAMTYKEMGDYQKALINYQNALAIRKKEDSSYYSTLFNMTGTYRALGEVDKAKQALHEISNFYLKTEGQNSLDYIMIENEIGVLEHDYGHYNEALHHYQKVLEYGKRLGRKEQTALAYKNMGAAYIDLDNFSLAKSYLEKALVIYEKLPLSTDLAANYEKLAFLAAEKKSYQQELEYYDKAISVHENLHLQNSPDFAHLLTNKAMAYQKHLDYQKANDLYEKAYKLLQKAEPKGKNMGFLLINMATLRVDQKEYAKAEPMLLEAIAMLKQTVGEKHPDVAYAYNNLAMVYSEQNQHDKSVDCYKKAIEISKATEGPNHPSTKLYNRNLLLEAINKGVSKKRGWF